MPQDTSRTETKALPERPYAGQHIKDVTLAESKSPNAASKTM